MKNRSVTSRSYRLFAPVLTGSAILATSPLAAAEAPLTLPLPLQPAGHGITSGSQPGGPILARAPAIAPVYAPARAETEAVLDLLDDLLADASQEIEVAASDLSLPRTQPDAASDGAALDGTIPNFDPLDTDTEIMIGLTIVGGEPDTEVVASVATRDGDGDNAARAGLHYEPLDYCCITIRGEQVTEVPVSLTGAGAGVHDLDRVFYLDIVDTAEGDGTIPDFNAPITIVNTAPAPGVTIHGGQFVEGSELGSAFLALIGETNLVPVIQNTAPSASVMGPDDTAAGDGSDFHARAGDQISLVEGNDHFVGVCNDGSPDNFCDGLTDSAPIDLGLLCAEAGDARCAVFRFDFDLVDNDDVDGNKQFEARFEAISNATLINDSAVIVIIDDDGTVSEQTVSEAGRYLFAFGGGTILDITFPELDDGGGDQRRAVRRPVRSTRWHYPRKRLGRVSPHHNDAPDRTAGSLHPWN